MTIALLDNNYRTSPAADEAKRWMVIGAYQAGASEGRIAKISNLSRPAVRNILLNYKRTGRPSIPAKIPKKVRQKLLVEYDENGELVVSSDEEKEWIDISDTSEDEHNSQSQRIIVDQGKSTGSRSSHMSTILDMNDMLTAAAASVDDLRILHSNSMSFEGLQNWTNVFYTPVSATAFAIERIIYPSSIPAFSTNAKKRRSPYFPRYQSSYKKASNTSSSTCPYNQDITGYSIWTHEDDVILLNYVLHHLYSGGWSRLAESRFNGRHTARLCYDRWKSIRSLLLKNLTK
ncbi:hypothetical protein BDF20DRAFT_915265 [Mycotypha africana]|uniref:uncharacterized protein n=1 Tax=Mycotypha africana TaxID=64632 RepID=UPI0022FFFDE5|nr:uncharacterized protein BDF20DRAFT_915265 [Mycotypha africana]KAI8971443.1 hypothetical protein BDF20DRAFT_915265 [Mycotypha africana]